jgi:hypothetical protein
MKNIKSSLLSVTVLLGAIFLTSCGASGPSFTQVTPPAGKGVVYIYRQSSMIGPGVFGTAKVNGRPITKIKNGGYYPYIATPGNNHFEITTEATNEANVMVEKGSQKYLKTTVGMGLLVGRLKFSEVSPEIGKNEISGCKLLKPIAP